MTAVAVTLSPVPVLQFFGNDTRPLVGGSVLTQVGGTNYATYQDSGGTTPLPNPIPLNSRGEVSNSSGQTCQLFLATGVTYVFTLFDSGGNQVNQYSYMPGVDISAPTNQLRTDLASTTDVTKGAALAGYNYALLYPRGTTVGGKLKEVLSIMDVPGTDATGATNIYTNLQIAVSAAAVLGKNVFFPAGKYLYNTDSGSTLLNQVRIVCEGVRSRTSEIPAHGAVILITGTTNTPFLHQSGAGMVGGNCYYPAQTDAACIANGGVPITYPPLHKLDFTNGPVQYVTISDCVVPNCYEFLHMDNGSTGAMGHIVVKDNNVYSIYRDIYCAYNSETIRINSNDFTFGVSNDASEAGLRKWTRAHATGVQFDKSDGFTLFDNLIFGKNIGFAAIVGTVAIDDFNMNKFDEVPNPIFVSSTGQMLASRMLGNQLISYNSQDHTVIGAGVTLNSSLASQLTMLGTMFGENTGNHAVVSGSASHRLAIIGGEMNTPGLFQTTGAYGCVNVNNVAAIVQLRSIGQMVGGANAITYGVLCASATVLDVQDCYMSAFQSDIRVTSCGSYVARNNRSDTTFGTISNDISGVAYPQETFNQWDKPQMVLPQYAGNAGAVSAGLPVGWQFYNTTSQALSQRV